MFKRNPRSFLRKTAEFFYPRGGWYRAATFVLHRMRRLPDPPHRISRGIAAGVFVCFTPFFGMHFFAAAFLAYILRGNILAALLATFFGNPITFPIIAEMSISLGSWMLKLPMDMHLPQIISGFGLAVSDLWLNFKAAFTPARADWHEVRHFYHRILLPYAVGGIIPGVIAGTFFYALSRPIITAYQKRRIKQLKKRYEDRMAERAAKAAREASHEASRESD